MAIAVVPFDIQIDHDSKKYDVHVPALSVPKCTNCGALSIDDEASEQIDRAFRKTAKLLTPYEIREGRVKLGYAQQAEFARAFGIGVSTLCRWETGAQIQQHFHDSMLRAFFEVPELREFLGTRHGAEYKALGDRAITV
jgi:putative zinc finger/helix-turn-helix YgiT family protein